MNRRQFLKAASAVGIGTSVAVELVDRALATPPVLWRQTKFIAQGGYSLIHDFFVTGNEDEPRIGRFSIDRGTDESMLFACAIHANQGAMQYRPMIGQSIVVPAGWIIRIKHDFDGAAHFTVESEKNGLEMHSFLLNRNGRCIASPPILVRLSPDITEPNLEERWWQEAPEDLT